MLALVTVASESSPIHSTNNNINGVITVTATKNPPTNNTNSNNNNNNSSNLSRNQQTKVNESTITIQNAPIVKKSRPKTSSPTRHGPQQCQV